MKWIAYIITRVRLGRSTLALLASGGGRYAVGMRVRLDYATAGPITSLNGVDPAALQGLGTDPVQICRCVAGLVIQPDDALHWVCPRSDSQPTPSARRTN